MMAINIHFHLMFNVILCLIIGATFLAQYRNFNIPSPINYLLSPPRFFYISILFIRLYACIVMVLLLIDINNEKIYTALLNLSMDSYGFLAHRYLDTYLII